MCRQSAGTCDLPEFCTGLSSDCPEDSFEMNGKPCYKMLQGSGTVQGYCYNGQCPTQEHHCWRLFGPGTLSMLLSKTSAAGLGSPSLRLFCFLGWYLHAQLERCTSGFVYKNVTLVFGCAFWSLADHIQTRGWSTRLSPGGWQAARLNCTACDSIKKSPERLQQHRHREQVELSGSG